MKRLLQFITIFLAILATGQVIYASVTGGISNRERETQAPKEPGV